MKDTITDKDMCREATPIRSVEQVRATRAHTSKIV